MQVPDSEKSQLGEPTTARSSIYVRDATAALFDYTEAKRPDLPHLHLYFETSWALVSAANNYDLDSDWYEVDQVVGEVELRLSESYTVVRRREPVNYFAEWDLTAK